MTFCASSSTIRVQPQPVRTDSACSKTRTQSQEQKAGHSFDARVQRHASGGTEGRCLQNIIKQQLGSIVKGETGSRHGTSSRCDSSRHEKAAGGSESAGRQGARCAGEDGSRTQQRWGGGHFGHVGSGRLESGHHAHGSRTEGGRGGQCV
ncbi:MAG TPA: hypothetical protein PLN94_13615, partial [Thiolinea sp.]|nr:hypothetical protein [Thiolinea sp.]